MGASSVEQWTTGGHGGAWWCTVVCGIALWSRSVLHHIEYTQGLTGTLTQTGHGTIQGGIAVAKDILWCTETGLCLVYQQIRDRETGTHRVILQYPRRFLILPLRTYPHMTLQLRCLVEAWADGCRLRVGLVYFGGGMGSTPRLTQGESIARELHHALRTRQFEVSQEPKEW